MQESSLDFILFMTIGLLAKPQSIVHDNRFADEDCNLLFHSKVHPVKQKGCAASRAEQKLRFSENLDAGVCEAHFCSDNRKLAQRVFNC